MKNLLKITWNPSDGIESEEEMESYGQRLRFMLWQAETST